jgi:ribonuclease BN (tRNA processing enzyme)
MRRLVILGAGDAFATGGKHTTSFLLDESNEGYLIDCGVSSLVRLKQINYPVSNLKGIILTHFHGDHFGGIPFIILSLKIEYDYSGSFVIAGPIGVREKVMELQEILYPGTGSFIDELNVIFVEYEAGWQLIGDLEVKAVPVTHAPPSSPHGLKLKWKGKMMSFSGDTEWDERLIDLAQNTELFITECNNYKKDSPGHLSLETLISKAPMLSSNRIMLSHMGREVLELKSCPFERLYDGMELTLW